MEYMSTLSKTNLIGNNAGISKTEKQRFRNAISRLRERSLAATRLGDFKTVARLTLETALLNQRIEPVRINLMPSLYGNAG
jgi:hypothetical protein